VAAQSALNFGKAPSGRVYPESEIDKLVGTINRLIDDKKCFVSLDAPYDMTVSLDRVAGLVTECFIEDGHIMLDYKLLPTPSGEIAQTLLDCQCKFDLHLCLSGMVSEHMIVTDIAFSQAYLSPKRSKVSLDVVDFLPTEEKE
jgi:hypothetical protein